jgi:hypothetical protein
MEGTNRPFDRLLFLYSFATSVRNCKEKKKTVSYPNISSVIQPVPHIEDLTVPTPPQHYILDSDEEPNENRGKYFNLQHLPMLILLLIFNLTNSIELHKRNYMI